jgi:uncharacterized protein
VNRLELETSPYLRQHADNPVHWWPWGEEAFAEARRRDVPVLLSVGYSACHWCHVMAHESFEDPDTAAVMNEGFVNVKVDREERPDVDALYMEAVQAMTGQGGWPMTVFLDPDGRPFFAGTYFPREPRHGRPSFTQLLEAITRAWRGGQRADLLEQADELTDALRRSVRTTAAGALPGPEVLADATARLLSRLDPTWGGFGTAPKFPSPMVLEYLLHRHLVSDDADALAAVTLTLDRMAAGGIYDHLGGGFARYSTDQRWLVPHFEKMLYDNALLVGVYTRAWQVTGVEHYRQVVHETIGYVRRDLAQPGGGFASAEDADSEGAEGRFYVWTPDEVREVLGDAADPVLDWYGITTDGNFEGASIAHRPPQGTLARPPAIEAARQRLFEHRASRPRPGLDDKVLTEWNALMVAALADAGAAFDEPAWVAAAEAAAEFLLGHLRRPDGRWLRSWQRDGGARHLAVAEDHAALLDAFVRLAEATGSARWYHESLDVAERLLALFWDDAGGGFFTTGDDAPPLIVRRKDLVDSATPSANSAAALALLRLAALSGRTDLEERARGAIELVGPLLGEQPQAFGRLLQAHALACGPVSEVVVVGDRPQLVREVHRRFLPTAVLSWGEPTGSPLWEGRAEPAGYVCQGFVCQRPATTAEELAAQLDALHPGR